MNRNLSLSLALVGGSLLFASQSQARSNYPRAIPNGTVNNCETCHINPAGAGARNAFGEDVRSHTVGGLPDWSALYDLDSDGDGQTNGEELGDPCGTWTEGAAPPRTNAISKPGDDSDTSADPNTPACDAPTTDGGTDPGTGGGDADAGDNTEEPPQSCCDQGSAASTNVVLAFSVFGLWGLRRRRRVAG